MEIGIVKVELASLSESRCKCSSIVQFSTNDNDTCSSSPESDFIASKVDSMFNFSLILC